MVLTELLALLSFLVYDGTDEENTSDSPSTSMDTNELIKLQDVEIGGTKFSFRQLCEEKKTLNELSEASVCF